MQQNGDIYLDTYAGWYSVRDEAYYAEEETIRRGGRCAPRTAGLAGRVGRGEELFLQLSAYQDRLLALYANAARLRAARIRAAMKSSSFVKGGLKDLSVSRTTFDWGIKVPDDSDLM